MTLRICNGNCDSFHTVPKQTHKTCSKLPDAPKSGTKDANMGWKLSEILLQIPIYSIIGVTECTKTFAYSV